MRTALDTTTLKRFGLAAGIALAALAPALAFAQDAAPAAADAAAAAAAAAPVPNKGDTAWMLVSTAFVLFMAVPGLALFYGGLVRSKNMLSVLMQVFVGFSLLTVLWCIYGYSFAFTTGRFPEPLRIKPGNRQVTEGTCRACHADIVSAMSGPPPHRGQRTVSCVRCHGSVGHLR